MKQYHIVVSFKGSQNGTDSDSFEAGTIRGLTEHLASAVLPAGWVKLVEPGTISGGPYPKLTEQPDAPHVLIESKVDGPQENKVEAPAETKKPAKFGGKKKG